MQDFGKKEPRGLYFRLFQEHDGLRHDRKPAERYEKSDRGQQEKGGGFCGGADPRGAFHQPERETLRQYGVAENEGEKPDRQGERAEIAQHFYEHEIHRYDTAEHQNRNNAVVNGVVYHVVGRFYFGRAPFGFYVSAAENNRRCEHGKQVRAE